MKFIHLSAYCQNCGENVSKEIAFCRSCGTALSEAQVQANIKRSREQSSIHVSVHEEGAPVAKKITGMVIVGLLEFLFVATVFMLSLLISLSFFPGGTGGHGGLLLTYLVVMTTVCIAGLTLGSYLSKKFCEKYPEGIEKFKRYFSFEEKQV